MRMVRGLPAIRFFPSRWKAAETVFFVQRSSCGSPCQIEWVDGADIGEILDPCALAHRVVTARAIRQSHHVLTAGYDMIAGFQRL